MRAKSDRIKLRLGAFPAINQVCGRYDLLFKLLFNKRIRFVKKCVEAFKFRPVGFLGITAGNGLDRNRLRKIFAVSFNVFRLSFKKRDLILLRLEAGGVNRIGRGSRRRSGSDYLGFFHFAFLLTLVFFGYYTPLLKRKQLQKRDFC